MARRRVCLDCPAIILATAYKGRCQGCNRKADQARGTRAERGYDAQYVAIKRAWQRRIDAGEVVHCWRCTTARIVGRDWHLGHSDDRAQIMGPECPPCNLRAAGRAAHGLSTASEGVGRGPSQGPL